MVIRPRVGDPLAAYQDDPELKDKSEAWRHLDVAILQHLVFERIVAPIFSRPARRCPGRFPMKPTKSLSFAKQRRAGSTASASSCSPLR